MDFKFSENVTFEGFRLYSVFRSALNGEVVASLVGEGSTKNMIEVEDDGTTYRFGAASVVDDYSHHELVDTTSLLYLGSQEVHANTLEHKDQTLFLGGLTSTGQDYSEIEQLIQDANMYDPETGLTREAWTDLNYIEFEYSSDIDYNISPSGYSYVPQMYLRSSQITGFKGGEKYRFALRFKTNAGTYTPSFWIGDAINPLYPVIDRTNNVIKRVVAKCLVPKSIYDYMEAHGLSSVQLMIAEATYADRSIKAQGIVCPTMFNVWERYKERTYAIPSWIMRPRGASLANMHFDHVENSNSSLGEIQCNHWDEQEPQAWYGYSVVGNNKTQIPTYEGSIDYDHLMILYHIEKDPEIITTMGCIAVYVVMASVSSSGSASDLDTFSFRSSWPDLATELGLTYFGDEKEHTAEYHPEGSPITIKVRAISFWKNKTGQIYVPLRNKIFEYLRDDVHLDERYIVDNDTLYDWWSDSPMSDREGDACFNQQLNANPLNTDFMYALDGYEYSNTSTSHATADRWFTLNGAASGQGSYSAAYYSKQFMFVDENIVTLNSPEIEYGAASFDNVDNYKFRIVGQARISGTYSDYTVLASHGRLSGENLADVNLADWKTPLSFDGLTAWPLWAERGLTTLDESEDEEYEWNDSNIVNYWLYMWNRSGLIHGFHGGENEDYSRLSRKVFASVHFSDYTVFSYTSGFVSYNPDGIRLYNQPSVQYANIEVGDENKSYMGNVSQSLMMPGEIKYPIYYSSTSANDQTYTDTETHYIETQDPVEITFGTTPHAVISLGTDPRYEEITPNHLQLYRQQILPRTNDSEIFWNYSYTVYPYFYTTGALVPWIDEASTLDASYPFREYRAHQPFFPQLVDDNDQYVFIGEIYYDYDAPGAVDNRYGGISENAIENCRFIPAGETERKNGLGIVQRSISHGAIITLGYELYGKQGDTYFQRWDCLKTKPLGDGDVNNAIDITSVMLETHINIDGRTDNQRGTKLIASIDTEQWGSLNPVYSQTDNFMVSRDLDDDANQDKYNSTVTWTLDKSDSAEIDEWTHITLADTLKLDGDKGSCNAIRRFQNSLIAFQDRAISEILFNSRTQLTTTDGVPVEIANSGKVDGKRYITNKYGCTNKWSIVEGKSALYFVDNINKAFCSFNGGIENLSASKGFSAWFRRYNNVAPWTPDEFDNIVAYYDRIHSDVYLVGNEHINEHRPTLVYNEMLGEFTSFFDYDSVPMMTNVEDRFVSFKDHRLWLQNEGFYCNFFDSQYDYWVNYRVTPDPFGDKIWTNIDYRADFYRVLDENATLLVRESEIIAGDLYDDNEGIYQEDTTFDNLQMWNEYQKTEIDFGKDFYKPDPARKKFRIWRLTIPRAMKSDRPSDSNKYGLDRMRNPWISLKFTKKLTEDNSDDQKKDLMQLHDITVRYFE